MKDREKMDAGGGGVETFDPDLRTPVERVFGEK